MALHRVPIADIFRQAVALHREKRFAEARSLYTIILEANPNHLGALQNFASLLKDTGQPDEALKLSLAAVSAQPESAVAHAIHGTILAALNRHEEAIAAYEAALLHAPGDAETRVNLGASLQTLGRHEEAVAQLEAAIAMLPDSPEAHNNLGISLNALERHEEAAAHLEKALAARADFAEAHNNLGLALWRMKNLDAAIAQFEKAIALKPDFLLARDVLASALVAAEREREAVVHFEAVLKTEPERLDTLNSFGVALVRLQWHERAEEVLRKALALDPDSTIAQIHLGIALDGQERPREAIAIFERVLETHPGNAEAHQGMGMALQMIGKLAESRGYFEKALELAPDTAAYHQSLAWAKRMQPDDPQLAAMERLAENMGSLPAEGQIALHFALGKAYHDLAQYERAFTHYQTANALKRPRVDYNEAATLDMFPHIESVFTGELIRAKEGLGDPSDVPVFIVGMPRSGTTLTEQMLASHPDVHGAGELAWINQVARRFRGPDVSYYFPEVAKRLDSEKLRALGADYVAHLRGKSAAARRITNKMPMDFRFLGLVHMMLPNAKIVHTRRDPVDTCLSNFTKNFAGGINYAFDLGELGRYWRAYDKIMEHWRAILPASVLLEVQYEELVNDFEGQSRRILAHCGLDWSEKCLAFYELDRPVRTASVTQVRQPVYQSSVGQGRVFGDLLRPLLQELHRL